MATPADPQKHHNYPPLDFRVGCTCPACDLAVLLWYTEDDHPARTAWQVFWDKWWDGTLAPLEKRPCIWQLRRHAACEPRPKPTAYKICSEPNAFPWGEGASWDD